VSPQAWAFAFWGGDFWIFHRANVLEHTKIYQVKRADGSMTKAMDDSGYNIVGAGVSTCAPISID